MEAAQELLEARLPSFYAHYDRDWRSYNARLVAQHRRDDYDRLLSAVGASHERLLAFVEEIPADEVVKDRGLRFKGWRVTIERLLKVEAGDERVHAVQLRELVAAADLPRP